MCTWTYDSNVLCMGNLPVHYLNIYSACFFVLKMNTFNEMFVNVTTSIPYAFFSDLLGDFIFDNDSELGVVVMNIVWTRMSSLKYVPSYCCLMHFQDACRKISSLWQHALVWMNIVWTRSSSLWYVPSCWYLLQFQVALVWIHSCWGWSTEELSSCLCMQLVFIWLFSGRHAGQKCSVVCVCKWFSSGCFQGDT